MAARQEEGRYETQLFVCFLVCKGLSYGKITSGWQGAPCLRRYGRELASKPTGDFVKEKGVGWAAVERLWYVKRLTTGCSLV